MNKLDVYVCENYLPEFQKAFEDEGFDDVAIIPFPSMCQDKSKVAETETLLKESSLSGHDVLLLCGEYCEALKLLPNKEHCTSYTTKYCSNHLAQEGLLDYIVHKQGYVIGSGWLKEWFHNLASQGFDKQTARQFYTEVCSELVFFDAGIDTESESNLKALSDYLGIPSIRISTDLDKTKYLLRAVIYEWRLHQLDEKRGDLQSQMQAQSAEYSTILDLMGKLTTYTNKRSAIEKIKEIFIMVMGAQEFQYHNSAAEDTASIDPGVKTDCNGEIAYRLNQAKNEFCIKIKHNETDFGSIHVGGFIFPEHIEEYLNFAIEIARICGLVLSNIEQYEMLIRSEKKFEYLSFHDSLTGLNNRAYINSILDSLSFDSATTVFSFDIDKLKYVNDTYGHAEGDLLILSVASLIKKCFRDEDVLARMGGDEFMAILSNCDVLKAKAIERRIKEAIRVHNESISDSHLQIGLSMGFVVSVDNEFTIEQLFQKADALMYEEKNRKRN